MVKLSPAGAPPGRAGASNRQQRAGRGEEGGQELQHKQRQNAVVVQERQGFLPLVADRGLQSREPEWITLPKGSIPASSKPAVALDSLAALSSRMALNMSQTKLPGISGRGGRGKAGYTTGGGSPIVIVRAPDDGTDLDREMMQEVEERRGSPGHGAEERRRGSIGPGGGARGGSRRLEDDDDEEEADDGEYLDEEASLLYEGAADADESRAYEGAEHQVDEDGEFTDEEGRHWIVGGGEGDEEELFEGVVGDDGEEVGWEGGGGGAEGEGAGLSSLHDREDGLERFLQFRKDENLKRSGKLDEVPAHTRAMLMQLFHPRTPDPMNGGRHARIGDTDGNGKDASRTHHFPAGSHFYVEKERALYTIFERFSRGAAAHEIWAIRSKVTRWKIERKMQLETSQRKQTTFDKPPTMGLREFLEMLKSLGLLPAVRGRMNDRGVTVMKTDVSAPVYSLAVATFKSMVDSSREQQQQQQQQGVVGQSHSELTWPQVKHCLYIILTEGPGRLVSLMEEHKAAAKVMSVKLAKNAPSVADATGTMQKVFSKIFDSIYEAYVYFDAEGHWKVSPSTFVQLCKRMHFPLTHLDIVSAIRSRLLPSGHIDPMAFVQTFAWHSLVPKLKLKLINVVINPGEEELYHQFYRFTEESLAANTAHDGEQGNKSTAAPDMANFSSGQQAATEIGRRMTFATYVKFLKWTKLVPEVFKVGGGGGKNKKGGRTIMRTDLNSAEYEACVAAYRDCIGGDDNFEWPEFKDAINHILTTGLRKLRRGVDEKEKELYNLRVRLAKNAPSLENPLQALKDELEMRFDSVYDAFVYFDVQGDWKVTLQEIKHMTRRLKINMTHVDVDIALEQARVNNHGSEFFSANGFVRQLRWQVEDKKSKKSNKVSSEEVPLYAEFSRCSIKPQAPKRSPNRSRGRSSSVAESANANIGLPKTSKAQISMSVKEYAMFLTTIKLLPADPKQQLVVVGDDEGTEGADAADDAGGASRASNKPEGQAKKLKSAHSLLNAHSIAAAATAWESNGMLSEMVRRSFDAALFGMPPDTNLGWREIKHAVYVLCRETPKIIQPWLEAREKQLKDSTWEAKQQSVTTNEPIRVLRECLAERFETVYDAFCFFDLDGDWNVSMTEMMKTLPKLKLPLTMADLREAIVQLMRKRDASDSMTVDPYDFVKGLAWHRKPSQVPGLRRELDVAKARRAVTAERAIQLAASNPHSLPKTAKVSAKSEARLSKIRRSIEACQELVRELGERNEVMGVDVLSLMMPEEERKDRIDAAKRLANTKGLSEKGVMEAMGDSRTRRGKIVESALERSEKREKKRMQAKATQAEHAPPTAQTLIKYVARHEREALVELEKRIGRLKQAVTRFEKVKVFLGVPIANLAMSSKERVTRGEVAAYNRNVRIQASLGEQRVFAEKLDEAKARREQIVQAAERRAAELRPQFDSVEFPSPLILRALDWFTDRARSMVEGEAAEHAAAREQARKTSRISAKQRKARMSSPTQRQEEKDNSKLGSPGDKRGSPNGKGGQEADEDEGDMVSGIEAMKRVKEVLLEGFENMDSVWSLIDLAGEGFVDEMGLRDGLINLGCEPEDSEAASELVAQDAEEGMITRALLEETIRMAENAKDEEEEDSGATKALKPAKSNRPLSPYKRDMVMREMPPQVLAVGNKKGDLQAMLTIHVAIERLRRGARILQLIKSRSVEGVLIDDLDMAKHDMHVEIDSIPANEREPAAILIQSVLRGRRKRQAIEEAKATGGSISAPQVVTKGWEFQGSASFRRISKVSPTDSLFVESPEWSLGREAGGLNSGLLKSYPEGEGRPGRYLQ